MEMVITNSFFQVPALRGTKVRVVNGVRTVTTPGHVPVVVDHNVQPVIVPHQPKVVVKQPTAVAIQPVPVRPVIQPVITPQVASPLRPQVFHTFLTMINLIDQLYGFSLACNPSIQLFCVNFLAKASC